MLQNQEHEHSFYLKQWFRIYFFFLRLHRSIKKRFTQDVPYHFPFKGVSVCNNHNLKESLKYQAPDYNIFTKKKKRATGVINLFFFSFSNLHRTAEDYESHWKENRVTSVLAVVHKKRRLLGS